MAYRVASMHGVVQVLPQYPYSMLHTVQMHREGLLSSLAGMQNHIGESNRSGWN